MSEELQHRVRITKPLHLGLYEVTQAEYQRVMGSNPSWFSPGGGGKDELAGIVDTSRLPVESVTWDEVVAFCGKLSSLPEEKTAGRVYRLPTEAEWEYACRAGAQTTYFSGDADASLGDYAWYDSNSGNRTHPVGEKKPNMFGLYDMHGHVWEWCQEWYDKDYYWGSPMDDPAGPAEGLYRVLRGGSWNFVAWYCRSAFRLGHLPVFRFYCLGFRAALVPPSR